MVEPAVSLTRCLRALVVMAACVAGTGAAHAYTLTDLYEAAVPVVDRSDRARDAAFREAMSIVLVKLTGSEQAPQQMRDTVAGARRYVQSYGTDADGRLAVGFDATAVDRAVTAAGLPLWGRQRPATLVMARVTDPTGSVRWLTASDPSPERELIDEAARQRGVPLVWPAGDPDATGLSFVADSAQGAALAARYGADAVLFGDLSTASASTAPAGDWTLVFGDTAASAAGDAGRGLGLAADSYAAVYAAAATDVTTVDLDVSGIADLAAYAAALNYLEGLTLVERVAVEEVAGDSVRLRLALRGDPTTLARAIALDRKFTPVDAVTVPGRLSYRLQP